MKLTYISYSRIPSREANSIHVMKMCHAFSRLGLNVELVTRTADERSLNDYAHYGVEPTFGITKLPFSRVKALSQASYTSRLWLRFHKRKPDVFYGRFLSGMLALSRTNVPIIYEAHKFPARWQQPLERRLFQKRNFHRLVVVSNALRQDYLCAYPWLSPQKVLVAHDGADLPKVDGSNRKPDRWKGRDNCLQVGYVGHLYPGRGIDILVALASRLPNVDFHIIGGTDSDVSYWRELTGQLTNLHLYGFVPPALGDAYRAHMDVLCAPYQATVAIAGGKGDTSRWMSPLKIFEYMAAGKAIISSELNVLKEVLTDNRNALLVQPDSVDAWEAAIRQLEGDPARRTQLGRSARADMEAYFTWSARAEHVLSGLRHRALLRAAS